MDVAQNIPIPPASARAFTVTAGQTVRIVDVAGGQPGDLVAFNSHDLSETFSQARTRVENGKVNLTRGDTLWTNRLRPRVMFAITADTGGPHSLLYTPCCRFALGKRFHTSRDGCYEHLLAALAPWNVADADMPDPLSIFFSVVVGPVGDMHIGNHTSGPGASLTLEAAMDCLVAVSTCSVPVAGRKTSPYHVQVLTP